MEIIVISGEKDNVEQAIRELVSNLEYDSIEVEVKRGVFPDNEVIYNGYKVKTEIKS